MGLDGVEMVMAVEEAFGIVITDAEAQQTRTLGQIVELVMKKVTMVEGSKCLSQRAFHLLRRQAANTLNVPKRDFRLDTPLEKIVPRENRRRLWQRFGHSAGATHWPELSRPGPLVTLIAAATVIVFFVTGSAISKGSGSWILGYLSASAAAGLLGWAAAVATKPFKLLFRAGYSNVEELTRFMVARNPEPLGANPENWTHERVWSLVRVIIVEQTGVTEFGKDSDIVKDLQID